MMANQLNLGRRLEDLRDRLSSVAEDLRDVAGTQADNARQVYRIARKRAVAAKDSVVETVEEYPVRSALVALGAGILLGAVWRRWSR